MEICLKLGRMRGNLGSCWSSDGGYYQGCRLSFDVLMMLIICWCSWILRLRDGAKSIQWFSGEYAESDVLWGTLP